MRMYPSVAAGVCTVLLAVFAAGAATAQDESAMVVVDRVEMREMRETASALGQIVARTQSLVATAVPGVVDDVEISVGEVVLKGAPLARLDTRALEIDEKSALSTLEREKASVAAAHASLKAAKLAFSRSRNLRASAAFSRSRYDDAEQEVQRSISVMAEAQAGALVAQATLDRVRYDLERSAIRAPFKGVVVARFAQPGAYLSVGDPVATMLDTSTLEIEADIPSNRLSGLAVGDLMDLTLQDGAMRRAWVRAIIPDENPATQTRQVRFRPDFHTENSMYAPGQSVTLHTPLGPPRMALTVAKDGLLQQAGGWVAFVPVDGVAQLRRVKIGMAQGDRFEVLSGLEEGELVVVRGNERLHPGQEIRFKAPSDAPVGAAGVKG